RDGDGADRVRALSFFFNAAATTEKKLTHRVHEEAGCHDVSGVGPFKSMVRGRSVRTVLSTQANAGAVACPPYGHLACGGGASSSTTGRTPIDVCGSVAGQLANACKASRAGEAGRIKESFRLETGTSSQIGHPKHHPFCCAS